jgi:hypothetical protein
MEPDMNESNLSEAFASYKAKVTRRARSAMTPEGDLVLSCRYAGFKRTEVEILRYEEDLSGETGEIAVILRTHLAEALSNECVVRAIVAIETVRPQTDSAAAATRTSYYTRKDLVGKVTAFDGQRFAVEFRRVKPPLQGKPAPRGSHSVGLA